MAADTSGITIARLARRPARIGWAVAVIAGVVNLISVSLPAEHRRLNYLHDYLPGTVISGAAIFVAAAGVAMLLIAGGLRRRSRSAWLVALSLLIASVFGNIAKGFDIEEALIETFLAGALFASSPFFTAKPARNTGRKSIAATAVVVLIVTLLFGILGIYTATDDLPFKTVISQTARMAIGLQPSIYLPRHVGRVLPYSLNAIFLIGLLFVVWRAFAPNRHLTINPATPEEAFSSDDSLAWFATRGDRATVRANRAVVAYGTQSSVALASGDPLGDKDGWGNAIDAFLSVAASQGRVAAVLACGATAAEFYRDKGLSSIYLGDEAVLDLSEFKLTGNSMKTVRGSRSRAERAGYTAEVKRTRDIDDETKQLLQELSHKWKAGSEERGFSMALGRLFEKEDDEAFVVVGRDENGTPRGFIHFVPWGRHGASLDVMRRDKEAIGILNDFMVAEAALQFPSFGIERLSLNFSALRGVLVAGSEPDATRLLRASRWLLLKLSGSFQIETLYRFNKKFNPRWIPRYLMLEAIEDGPRVLYAALRAEGLLHFSRRSNAEEDQESAERI